MRKSMKEILDQRKKADSLIKEIYENIETSKKLVEERKARAREKGWLK
ncbi:hypothetical protein ACQUWN_23040 [Rossellomorea aquimaris]|nr:hypothetical protein [Rossellomorea vietnamensis]